MFPGRPYLGVGSGEALNEAPLGAEWPPVAQQVERMEEALELIHRLFAGERVDHRGRHFSTKSAFLHSRPRRRPPIYVSAFGPKAAAVAARWGDGLWTLADPDTAPRVIDAYRSAAEDDGREPGEIFLQAGVSYAPDDDAALEGARVWKGAQPDEFYTEDWHDPKKMYEEGARQVSDDQLRQALIISADPEVHVERVREIERMGATTVVLMNNSGADPDGMISVYGERVLSALRGARTGGAA
jgi:coenzyme F420-dependent glucose-6-phosphate dehydrogenase